MLTEQEVGTDDVGKYDWLLQSVCVCVFRGSCDVDSSN